MQDTRFSYLKNNLILFLFIIITGASCSPDTLWDIPVETVKTQLYISDYSFLDAIDFTDKKPSDALVLGREAPYYFSLILAKKKNSEFEQKMLSESWASGEKLWKEESGLLILKRLLDEEKYELLSKNALRFLNDMKYEENESTVKKIYIEALYWLKKDEEAVKALDLYFPGGCVASDSEGKQVADPELLLFKSVASCRLSLQGWQNEFVKLFLEFDTTAVHQRAYNFLVIDENTYKSFDESMQRFFTVKNLLSIGKISIAFPILETYLNSIDKTILERSSIIAEMGLAYLANDELARGLSFLTAMSQKLSGAARLDALEMAGRLARKKKDYDKAVQLFETALKEIVDPFSTDRVAWFRLASLLEISSDRFIDELLLYSRKWGDPVYFDDIIRKAIGVLVMEKKWKQIERFYSMLPQSASAETRTQLLFLHTRFLMTNLIPGKKETVDREIENNLKQIALGNDNDYYTFLASSLLKSVPPFIKNIEPGAGKNSNSGGSKKASENKPITAEEKFVSGFFDFGLMEEGYDAAYRFRDILSPPVILAVAVRLNRGGYIKHSIWLLNTLFSMKDHTLSRKEMMYSYPLAYESYIKENAEEWEFDASFFYALIREESAFDAQNTSTTGASGLSQLMPDTAKEVAGWLKLKNYDLADPETNLAIGSYYYARLQKKLQSIPKTLIAYNAGQGNLRSWEKEFGNAGNLPPDLFIEAIPYRETREYVKKIIVTACIYAWLYQQRTCEKTMAAAYPELFSRVMTNSKESLSSPSF